LVAELLAETLGTFFLLALGLGAAAQTILTPFSSGSLSLHIGWGVAFMMAIYVAGGVSGAHLNPAVTVALAFRRGFPWAKVLPYSLAQTTGAFLGALVIRWNYWETLNQFDPDHGLKSQIVFSTLPGNGVLPVSQLGALRDQVIGTAIFVGVILAVTDARNTAPGANMAPFVLGFLIIGIGISFGADAGFAINPARDLGARLATWICGWSSAWSDQNGEFYAWVPIVGPLVGGTVGAYLYDFFVGSSLPVYPEVGETRGEPVI